MLLHAAVITPLAIKPLECHTASAAVGASDRYLSGRCVLRFGLGGVTSRLVCSQRRRLGVHQAVSTEIGDRLIGGGQSDRV